MKACFFCKRSGHKLHIFGQSSGCPGRITFHADWSSLKKIYHLVAIKVYTKHLFEQSSSGPGRTTFHTDWNKCNHLVVKRVYTEHIA